MGRSSLVALTKLAAGVLAGWGAYLVFGLSGIAAVFALLPLIYATYGYFRGAQRCGYKPGELSTRVIRMATMVGSLFLFVGWIASRSRVSPFRWVVFDRSLSLPDSTTIAAVTALILLALWIGRAAFRDLKSA
jgi:hypothetical protein